MPRKANPNPLAPAETIADWEAQGWDAEPEIITSAPRLEATVSIRFDPDGALLLRRAARMKGMTKSEFVRQATLQAAQKAIAETPLPITMWTPGEQAPSAETQGHSVITQKRDTRLRSRPTATTRSSVTRKVVR